MNKKQKIVVLGIIEDDSGKILVSQRLDPEIPSAHLKWDIIGGTNEFGESLEETLQREINEETNLKVKILSLFPKCVSKKWNHNKGVLHVLVFCYHCRLADGKLKNNDSKIKKLKWVSPKDAQKLDLLPTTKEFIDLFAAKK